jgi:hypothetical protein
MRFGQLPKSAQNMIRNNPTLMAQYYYDASRTVKNASDCNGYNIVPNIETVLIEIPTDATVTVPSQMALPGCNPFFKHEMNEVLDHDNPDWNKVIYRSGVNHMQERNSDQTDAMLRRIYEGYETPEFFRLIRK